MSRIHEGNLHRVNTIISPQQQEQPMVIATSNEGKRKQWEHALGTPVEKTPLDIKEVQDDDPQIVLHEKAKQAYIAGGGTPIWVEDTSFFIAGMGPNRPGVYADQFTGTIEQRAMIVQTVDGKGRDAEFRVGMAIFDGNDVTEFWGSTSGRLSKELRTQGDETFGFDDMFIPDNQVDDKGKKIPKKKRKTLAEMSPNQRADFSPRSQIAEQLRVNPVTIEGKVFALPEPDKMQLDEIERESLSENERALRFGFDLQAISGTEPDPQFKTFKRRPFYEIPIGEAQRIKQYVINQDSADGGIIVIPWDTTTKSDGTQRRLEVDGNGDPLFKQMPDGGLEMATAIRAEQFARYQNEKFYGFVREWKDGQHHTMARSNQRSEVIEDLLKITESEDGTFHAKGTAAFNELGYAREYSDDVMSRNNGVDSLMVDASGILTSVFSAGGMPPVSGNLDVVKSMALTFHEVHIPRNGLFLKPERRVRLFQEAVAGIDALELPQDIRELVVGQIGISIGCQNPEEVVEEVKSMYEAGCRSVRIYTTNPDARVPQTAEALRQTFGEDLRIAVAPIVDLDQARKLIAPNIQVNTLIAGHGGGENCTSLKGGGAANGPELTYLMSIDSAFNQTAIGHEGGTGDAIGVPLGYVDKISLNGRLIDGGPIEVGGGLMMLHSSGEYVQPYHGSASAFTQWIEAQLDPEIAERRLSKAAKMRNIEGEPNYKSNVNSVHSIFDNLLEAERLARVALADQRSRNINDLRANIAANGYVNHRNVTSNALVIARAHRQ